ncbi:hypothetical protein COCCADRAFT_36091 [Bipolaris zeicola 26-R-13]|uniref:Uncharacterized protein n=1 Tax=Cochliobolus carbonum (strain 26-R-13) TaxID=930089 RepID=W6YFM1_COCC2|nr:uncharacterized protein COCCADRAFT_36091 [Bipolaris zeicola 26-R-13]EUC34234.1 hypothetical protein COCCADRAFT_36091 [Bipolaris zeicola 26-R-13]
MTTTIALPYDDLRPHVLRPKKSFFQRLNTPDHLISRMRSLKVDDSASLLRLSSDRSRVSTVSLLSTPDLDRDYFPDLTKHTELERPVSCAVLSPPTSPMEGSFFPIQQFLAPMDRKTSKEFVQGMQTYVHWKQATYESTINQAPSTSPPQTPQSSYSWTSSKSSRSEMSDEEMDDWLDKPMDADVHRFRKLSAASLESLPSSDGSEIKIHVIQEQPDEEEIAAQGNRRQLSSMWRETWCWETNSQNRTANDQGYEIVLPTSTADDDSSAK